MRLNASNSTPHHLNNFRKVGKDSRRIFGKYQFIVYRNFKSTHFMGMDKLGLDSGFGLYQS